MKSEALSEIVFSYGKMCMDWVSYRSGSKLWKMIKSFRKYLFTRSCCESPRDFEEREAGVLVPEVGNESADAIFGVRMFVRLLFTCPSSSVSVSVSRSVSVAVSPSVAVGVVYKSETSLMADSFRLCDAAVVEPCEEDGLIGMRAASSFFFP